MELIKKYYSINGRINRKQYWLSLLTIIGVNIGLFLIIFTLSRFVNLSDEVFGLVLFFIYLFIFILPFLAISVRRLHDTNHSGWFLFFLLFPLIGLIVILVIAGIDPGRPEENKYNYSNIKVTDLFSYQGRVPRSTFWGYTGIFTILVSLLIGSMIDEEPSVALWPIILFPLALFTFVIYLGVILRRLHDINESGWHLLLYLIPIIGPIWFYVDLGFSRGDQGKNKYGPDPLQIGASTMDTKVE